MGKLVLLFLLIFSTILNGQNLIGKRGVGSFNKRDAYNSDKNKIEFLVGEWHLFSNSYTNTFYMSEIITDSTYGYVVKGSDEIGDDVYCYGDEDVYTETNGYNFLCEIYAEDDANFKSFGFYKTSNNEISGVYNETLDKTNYINTFSAEKMIEQLSLTELIFDKTYYSKSDTLKVKLNISSENVTYFYLELVNQNDYSYLELYPIFNFSSGYYEAEVNLNGVTSGEWKVNYIYIEIYENSNYEYLEYSPIKYPNGNDYYKAYPSNFPKSINVDEQDNKAPIINYFKFDKESYLIGENIKIELSVSDDTGVAYGYITLVSNKGNKIYFYPFDNSLTTKYMDEIYIDSDTDTGEWKVEDIYISDKNGNYIEYNSNSSSYPSEFPKSIKITEDNRKSYDEAYNICNANGKKLPTYGEISELDYNNELNEGSYWVEGGGVYNVYNYTIVPPSTGIPAPFRSLLPEVPEGGGIPDVDTTFEYEKYNYVCVNSLKDLYSNESNEASKLNFNSKVDGSISYSKDIDWFKFEVKDDGILKIYTNGDTDTKATLYSVDNLFTFFGDVSTLLDEITNNDDKSTNNSNFYIEVKVEKGVDYFLKVEGFDENSVGKYELINEFSSSYTGVITPSPTPTPIPTTTPNIQSGELIVSPSILYVEKNTSKEYRTLKIIGGKPPYTVFANIGRVDDLTRDYSEFVYEVNQYLTKNDVITIQDSSGKKTTIDVIYIKDIELTPSNRYVTRNTDTNFTVSNAIGKINCQIVDGDGDCKINQNIITVTTSTIAKTITLKVTDDIDIHKKEVKINVVDKLEASSQNLYFDDFGKNEPIEFFVFGGIPYNNSNYYQVVATAGDVSISKENNKYKVTYNPPNRSSKQNIIIRDASNQEVLINVYITKDLKITPSNPNIEPLNTINFNAISGTGEYTWSVEKGSLSDYNGDSVIYTAPSYNTIDTVSIIDSAGTEAKATIIVGDAEIENKVINLNSGWNLASIPVDIGLTYIEKNSIPPLGYTDITILGDFESIWTFIDNKWSSNSDNNFKIDSGIGFWIKTNNSKTLTFTGESYVPTLSNLSSGWSLVGTGETLANIDKLFNLEVWSYKNSIWSKNPSSISSGDGFWVKK